MAYNKNINIGPNNTVNISGSLINVAGALSGSEISGTHAQFSSLTASNFEFGNDLYVSGGLTVGKYIQMLPVNEIQIPTNQTASYIPPENIAKAHAPALFGYFEHQHQPQKTQMICL